MDNFNAETLLNSLFTSTAETISPLSFTIVCLTSVLLGYCISLSYKKYYYSTTDQNDLPQSLVMLCLLFSVVTMVIGSNIARSFGLIGALSIIRFRNTVKSTIDIYYIFWVLTAGMMIGAGYIVLSFVFIVITLILQPLVVKLNKTNDLVSTTISYNVNLSDFHNESKRVKKLLAVKKLKYTMFKKLVDSNNSIQVIYRISIPSSCLEKNYIAKLCEQVSPNAKALDSSDYFHIDF